MAKLVAATSTKKKAAAGGGAAKAKRAAGGKKKPAGGAAAKAAGKTKPAATKATSARKKPATAPAAAPRAALGGDAAASRATKLPAAAMAPDVTRHDVNWGAEGARRHQGLAVSRDGAALANGLDWILWAQGAVGVTRGKHWFSVTVTRSTGGFIKVGWVDRNLRVTDKLRPGDHCELGPSYVASRASGATFSPRGFFEFGTAPLARNQKEKRVPKVKRPCTVGCLLDADAGAMTVFVNGKPLKQQCEYKFPNDGREWAPSVGFVDEHDALFSNSV
jgi:hypothetical protein